MIVPLLRLPWESQVVRTVGDLFDLPRTVGTIRPEGGLEAIASTDGRVQAAGTGLTERVIATGKAAVVADLLAEPELAFDDGQMGRHSAQRRLLSGTAISRLV